MYSTHVDAVAGQEFDEPYRRTIKHLYAPWLAPEAGLWVGMSEVPAGSASNPHRHPEQEESFFVFEGTGEVVVDGVARRVGPGDLVVVARGEEHQLRNTGQATLRVLATVVPPFAPEQFATVHDPAAGR